MDNAESSSAAVATTSSSSSSAREHMFEKVVTPSDVGKLNRLVIPKQHAEKHLPLDASSIDKGLLLSFEDRSGKPWRFRYSYWSSSQSYVMTKGWSRFVKEKRLDAGDTVSFSRGVGGDGTRLFIDWKRAGELARVPPPGAPPPPPRPNYYPMVSFACPATSSNNPWSTARRLPVGPGREPAKRVRIFGVNLDTVSPSPSPSEEHSLDLEL